MNIKTLNILMLLILLTYNGCYWDENSQEKQNQLTKSVDLVNTFNINRCYADTVKWLITDSTFFDTIIFFRNYRQTDSSMRIVCNLDFIDPESESLIWNNENVLFKHEGYKRLNKFEFISYEKHNDVIIMHLYLTDKESFITLEMERYQIKNNEIIGINIFPRFLNEFVPYKEFLEPDHL